MSFKQFKRRYPYHYQKAHATGYSKAVEDLDKANVRRPKKSNYKWSWSK